MAKPKRKPDKCKRDGECWPGCPDWNPNQRHPDTDRLDALLRWQDKDSENSGVLVFTKSFSKSLKCFISYWRRVRTRRDIDKLLKEERRGKE